MTSARPSPRQNLFLIAAIALPVIVVVFFILASAVPRWLVAPPAYDMVIRANRNWDSSLPRISVDYAVRDGRLQGTVRPIDKDGYPQLWTLFVLDHQTLTMRELPVSLPSSAPAEATPLTIDAPVLSAPSARLQVTAPDGYQLLERSYRSPGIVGDVFGSPRSSGGVSVGKGSRIVSVTLPPPYEYESQIYLVGWIVAGDAR